MDKKFKAVWRILKPFLTFGISIIIGLVAKKNPILSVPIEAAGDAAKDFIENLDDSETPTDTTKIDINKPE